MEKLTKQQVIAYLKRYERKIIKESENYWDSNAQIIHNCILALEEK